MNRASAKTLSERPKPGFVGFRTLALGALLATSLVGICADSADAQPRRPARPTTKSAPKATTKPVARAEAPAPPSAAPSAAPSTPPSAAPSTPPSAPLGPAPMGPAPLGPASTASAKPAGKTGSEAAKLHTDDKGGASETRSADGNSKVLKFGQVEIEGRLKSPQIVYFLRRVRAEFAAGDLGHRSFLGELKETRNQPEL